MTPASRTAKNGHVQNGHIQNGQVPSPPKALAQPDTFNKPVILKQSPRWARYVVWTIVGVTVSAVTWACLAKIEEAVPAQGKLEPKGVVQPVQAPISGVIQEILVEEGESVTEGDVLILLDTTETQATLDSRLELRERLLRENNYYKSQLNEPSGVESVPETLSPEITGLTSDRTALIEDNRLYQAILQGDVSAADISPEQRARLEASLGSLSSQVAIDQSEIDQLSEELTQVNIQLNNARQAFAVEREILDRISPLVEEGAIADLQRLQQDQEVNNRRTEVNSLIEEQQRLTLAIGQAEESLRRTEVGAREELLNRIGANNIEIANIDSRLNKEIVENENQLEEIDAEISRLQYTLNNQELRAPLTGQVFNLRANQPGYVANATEPILEIVPDDTLVARVDVTNRDIGFVTQQFYQQEEPLKVDVRIDSFPFSEFGDVEGTVVHIASDALPPDEINPFYRFPVEIDLESQTLGETLPLQSGMSVSANIKLRKRRVITILTDLFVRKIDSLRSGG